MCKLSKRRTMQTDLPGERSRQRITAVIRIPLFVDALVGPLNYVMSCHVTVHVQPAFDGLLFALPSNHRAVRDVGLLRRIRSESRTRKPTKDRRLENQLPSIDRGSTSDRSVIPRPNAQDSAAAADLSRATQPASPR